MSSAIVFLFPAVLILSVSKRSEFVAIKSSSPFPPDDLAPPSGKLAPAGASFRGEDEALFTWNPPGEEALGVTERVLLSSWLISGVVMTTRDSFSTSTSSSMVGRDSRSAWTYSATGAPPSHSLEPLDHPSNSRWTRESKKAIILGSSSMDCML